MYGPHNPSFILNPESKFDKDLIGTYHFHRGDVKSDDLKKVFIKFGQEILNNKLVLNDLYDVGYDIRRKWIYAIKEILEVMTKKNDCNIKKDFQINVKEMNEYYDNHFKNYKVSFQTEKIYRQAIKKFDYYIKLNRRELQQSDGSYYSKFSIHSQASEYKINATYVLQHLTEKNPVVLKFQEEVLSNKNVLEMIFKDDAKRRQKFAKSWRQFLLLIDKEDQTFKQENDLVDHFNYLKDNAADSVLVTNKSIVKDSLFNFKKILNLAYGYKYSPSMKRALEEEDLPSQSKKIKISTAEDEPIGFNKLEEFEDESAGIISSSIKGLIDFFSPCVERLDDDEKILLADTIREELMSMQAVLKRMSIKELEDKGELN
ncbi:uncharacterized protein KGF55_004795 [Candida pseudojiufengensis]|uniref:uncharacterized protein n=1 Tax=Candida pseudojiufengensis TaxID=497109 RepID=UPI002224F3A0|nr:uncharacterized protein KGF55_004795 [Candida pseudojiufengensis]KAI5960072.1 hypothetical protein KGF55_004795 [Candida pseudojiufengensis]